ncbi:outer membrane beta-barrel protein [Ramlibacter sp. XY19]|uniref:outer membrane beta-barrel protein n=1 Tax=Ramlibacter paludis TaxID=2908000 RepID=UPI0023DBC2E6|nr:outer membrane beta-barrel protein [Ramlibacter paludis]MCG2594376.1 outer membrane beta-barrel protein [Ramlibacter paludis]
MTIISRNVVAFGCMAGSALLATPSLAQGTGWYAGAGIGQAASTIDRDRIIQGLANESLLTNNIDERDRKTGYKLFGGYQMNRYFAVEGGYFDLGRMGFTASTTPAGTLVGDVRFQGLNLDLVGTLPVTDRFSLLGRVGGAYVRARGAFSSTGAVVMPYPGASTSERKSAFEYGLGLAWRLSEAWELRAEAERIRVHDSVGNRGDIDLMTLGVVYRFGAAPAPAPAPRPAYVAPPSPPPPPPPPPAPTPPPPPVAAARTPVVTVHFSADALFDFNRSELRAQGTRELDAFASEMRGVAYDSIRVIGHTDRLGPSAYNGDLSRRRAAAVAAYLARAGLNAAKIVTSGAGETQPLPSTAHCRGNQPTPALVACLQPDRRVDVQVEGSRSP